MMDLPDNITKHSHHFSDENNNKSYFKYFGGEEGALKALASLESCRNCSNCSNCSDCLGCSDCRGCSGCLDCSNCLDCSDCSGCSDCLGCSNCRDCLDCSDCSGCSDCLDCSDCSGCSDCLGCSNCRDCLDCSDCSGCSDCLGCSNCRGKVNNNTDEKNNWHENIPTIDNIHSIVLDAATKNDESLDMSNWHICETTHCRAGWVVSLSGEAGRKLEKLTDTCFAAMQIYKKSSPDIKVSPNKFFLGNDESIADMKRCAELEAEASKHA